jgi:hypothetical protein
MKTKLICLLLISGLVLAGACKKDNVVLKKVGDKYGGGVVAYLLQAGDAGYDAKVQHGLIAAEADQIAGIVWSSNGIISSNTNNSDIGAGKINTENIVIAEGMGTYAAKLCADLSLNGYDDWYLPCKIELLKLQANKVAIGGFQAVIYWSSTQSDQNTAFALDFTNQTPTALPKSSQYKVRAIRYF